MGYGDFKLLAALGAWTGWQVLPFIVLVSAGAGRDHRRPRCCGARSSGADTRIPFGPYLALGGLAGPALGAPGGGRLDRATSPSVKRVVGLTGGIGSGKTTVAATALRPSARRVVDTDEISRGLTGPAGAAMAAVRRGLRRAFRRPPTARSTARPCARSPSRTRSRARGWRRSCIRPSAPQADATLARGDGPYAVVVVPLLFETRGYLDRVGAHAGGRLPRGAAGEPHGRPLGARRRARCAPSWRRNGRAGAGCRWPTT